MLVLAYAQWLKYICLRYLTNFIAYFMIATEYWQSVLKMCIF